MPDDHYQSEKLIVKSLLSHKGLIPSINFNEYEYSLYLQYAPPDELEKDIVSTQTYEWITVTIKGMDKPTNFSQARLGYYD